MMKKTLIAAMTSLVLMSGSAYAYGDCCDDQSMFQGGNFYAQGEWLWWKLRRCELDYAIPLATNDVGRFVAFGPTDYLSIHPGYTTGWRVAAGYQTCGGYDFRVRYTNYDTHKHVAMTNEENPFIPTRALRPVQPVPTVNASYSFDFDNIDIEIGSISRDCGDTYTRFFIGAQMTFIKERLDVHYIEDAEEPFYSSLNTLELDAYGLLAGYNYHRDFGYCLGFYTSGSLGLLAGSYDIRNLEKISDVTTPEFDLASHPTCFLGHLTLAAGLDYKLYCGPCGFATLSLGYEFQSWYNTKDFLNMQTIFSGEIQSIKPNRTHSSLGLDGLVLRLTAGY